MPATTATPQVLCLGEVLQDCLTQGQQRHCYLGGAPANVAAGLVKLGTPAAFIGAVGTDVIGDRVVQQLQALKIDLSGIQRIANSPTRQVIVQHQANGDRTFVGFAPETVTEFADEHLQARQLPRSLFETARFLVLGTLGFAAPETSQALNTALELAQQHHLTLVLDVNWRPIFWPNPDTAKAIILDLLPQSHLLKLSQEEAHWLFGTEDAQEIYTQIGGHVGLVVITAGAAGGQFATENFVDYFRAYTVQVVDTTGAGDGFVAGLLHSLNQAPDFATAILHKDLLEQAIRYASAVGAIVSQGPGAIAPQPTHPQVQTFLTRQPLHS